MEAGKGALVWLADIAPLLESRLAGYAGWLGESERQRYSGFTRPERRLVQHLAQRIAGCLRRRACLWTGRIHPRAVLRGFRGASPVPVRVAL